MTKVADDVAMNAHVPIIIVLAGIAGCQEVGDMPENSREPEPFKEFAVAAPRPPDDDEVLRALVTVGDLARGNMIIARTSSGEILGSIVTTGLPPGQRGGVFPLPIPREEVRGKEFVLRLEVVTSDASSKVRAPTSAEVEDIATEIIPATQP